MKKVVVCFYVLLLVMSFSICIGAEGFDAGGFINEIKEYSSEMFPEFSDGEWLSNILTGDMELDGQDVLKRIFNIFLKEFKENIGLLFKIMGIALLCSVLKNLQNTYGGSVSEIAFYVCYMLIVILVVTTFTNIVEISIKAINKLNNFMSVIVPVLITLLVSMGNIATVTTMQPVMLGMISVISSLISNLVIPVIMISTILNLVSNISSYVNVDKIGKFFKKSVMYVVEFCMIVFVGLLSLEGSLSANVDGITAKVAKTAISNTVPVVGKLVSDAADSVIGAMSITKNAVGVIGILIIIAITISPIIKSFLLMFMFNLTSAVCETLADSRISKAVSSTADSIKLIFGIMVLISALFIIAITLMIKMSNFSLMYR